MKRTGLGRSGLEVTRLCLGTWNMDGSQGWGPQSDDESIELIRQVLDTGCNFIDTAHAYGSGHSEEVLGRALEGRRDDVIVSTKLVQSDPARVEGELDAALERLRTDYIDIYICHWPAAGLVLDDFMAELARLREKGKARAIGASNFNLAQMAVAAQHGAAVLQPPFNPLWRLIDGDVLPFCHENNIAVTPYSPLAQGLMTGRYTRAESSITGGPRKANRLFREPVFTIAREAARVVDGVADEIGATSSQVTLAWCLATPGVTAPIVGISRMAQWEENLGSLEIALTHEQYGAISEAGLRVWRELPDDASMWG